MPNKLLKVLLVCLLLAIIFSGSHISLRPIIKNTDSSIEFVSAIESTQFTNSSVVEYGNVELRWLGHAGFQFKTQNIVVYVDPYGLNLDRYYAMADYIICTHDHYDHCNTADIARLSDNKTTILTVRQAEKKLSYGLVDYKEVIYILPNDTRSFGDISFEFVPAYNIQGEYHPKWKNYVGVILDFNGARFYHAGDTDHIPEMKTFDTNIALLPVSGASQMTAEEAVEAVESLKISSSNLELAIPIHYGFPGQPGTAYDAQYFHRNADVDTLIMAMYTGEEEPIITENTQSVSGFGWFIGLIVLGTGFVIYNQRRKETKRLIT
ncbi:MAG: MBL fold metallo-hydrolase [Candidatus Hodarchaeota archaeon]